MPTDWIAPGETLEQAAARWRHDLIADRVSSELFPEDMQERLRRQRVEEPTRAD